MSEKGILDDETTAQPRARASIVKVFIGWAFILTILGSLLHPRSRCYHPLAQGYSRLRPMSIEDRVHNILSETPLIGSWNFDEMMKSVTINNLLTVITDGHNDLAILIRVLYNNHIYEQNFTEAFARGGMAYHVDLPRLKEGQNGGAFWSVYTPCPANGSDYSEENYLASEAPHLRILVEKPSS